MAFNNLITEDNADSLIPIETAAEIIKELPEQSAVLQLAKRLPNMSSKQRDLPVTSGLPTASFLNGTGAKKETTNMEWTDVSVVAEEVAVIVPIHENVLSDSEFDIWGEVQPALVEAFGLAIDQAVLYGTDIPATWTTALGAAGLVARSTAASNTIALTSYTDLYEALLGETGAGAAGLLGKLEEDGFIATGHLADLTMRRKIRNTRDSDGGAVWSTGQGIGTSYQVGILDGAPLLYPLNGSIDNSQSLVIAGAWNKLVYSMRQDMTFSISREGIISDAAGNIIHNLFQEDMVALRAVMRLGFALPNPINRIQTNATARCPFAVLTAT